MSSGSQSSLGAPKSSSPDFKELAKVAQQNLKSIHDRCQNDLEMQMMVLAKITEIEDTRSGKKATLKRKRSQDNVETQVIVACPEVDSSAKLTKNMQKYSAWKKGMLLLALQYLEPAMFMKRPGYKKIDSETLMKQLLEFALDLNFSSELHSDRAKSDFKKQALDRLKSLYIKLGNRMGDLQFAEGQYVDWQSQGFYTARVTVGKVVMQDTKSGKVKEVLVSELPNTPDTDSRHNVIVHCNWNRAEAFMKVGDEKVVLLDHFPRTRPLKARLSDEMEVTQPQEQALRVNSAESFFEQATTPENAIRANTSPLRPEPVPVPIAEGEPPSPTGLDLASAFDAALESRMESNAAIEEDPQVPSDHDDDDE
eukprot:5239835-Amphidinium_carterae.3